VPEDGFPALILIVSGGHTELILMTDHGQYQRLGGTLDDAAGEAFDKVARLLNLGFPGGPVIQRIAQQGDPTRYPLPRALSHSTEHRFNFSFSGLKTAVLNLVRQIEQSGPPLTEQPSIVADIAAAFQQAVADVLVTKSADAAITFGARQVCICGGVSANAMLRKVAQSRFAQLALPLYIPPLAYCTDNAAMIGAAAFYRWRNNIHFPCDLSLDVYANLPLA
jgi:N6-L-threonylcarbamoyladenine synthase